MGRCFEFLGHNCERYDHIWVESSGHLITWLMMIGSGGISSACSRCGISENFIRCVSKICRTEDKKKKKITQSQKKVASGHVKHFDSLLAINKASITQGAMIQPLRHQVLNLLSIQCRPPFLLSSLAALAATLLENFPPLKPFIFQ